MFFQEYPKPQCAFDEKEELYKDIPSEFKPLKLPGS